MAKKTKTKGWVKGVIALVVIGVVGVLGYYGANGELFQGRSFRVAAPKMERLEDTERLKDMERLKVDGVADKVVQDIALDTIDVQKKVVFDFAQLSKTELVKGDTDVEMLSVTIDNKLVDVIDIEKVAFLQDGGGLENYELFVDGIKIDADVEVQKVYLDKLEKTVDKVIFTFRKGYVLGGEQSIDFVLKADVIERLERDTQIDGVSIVLDSFLTDKGLETNNNVDFNAFLRVIK